MTRYATGSAYPQGERRPPRRIGGAAGGGGESSVVGALHVLEALRTGDVAAFEPEPGDAVAADHGVAAAGARRRGGDEDQPAGGSGGGGGGHDEHDAPRGGRAAHGPRATTRARGSTSGRSGQFRCIARAARAAGVQRGPHRRAAGGGAGATAAPLKARFATVAKPASSSRSASSRWAVRSADGSSRVRPARTSSRPGGRPGRTSSAPASPTSQTPSAPRSGREPGARVQRARVVAEQVAEQAERRPLGRVAGARPRADDVRAAVRVQRRDPPRVHDGDRRDRERQRLERHQQHRGGEERDRVRERAQRPAVAAAAQARGVDPRPPVDGRGLGEDGRHQPPAIGRRRITSSASSGSSRTCSACPSPALTTA